MNYDLVLFDVDDTLLDFGKAKTHALARVLGRHAPADRHEEMAARFQEINTRLWRELERGAVTKDEVLVGRFVRLFEEFSLPPVAEEANDLFLASLADEPFLLEGALALVEGLSGRIPLGVVSNGHGPTQRRRLARAGLARFFAFALISDEVGEAKPHPLIFRRALEEARLAPGARVLMIGDNLHADISGAHAAGFDTCWLGTGKLPEGTASPTFVAKNLAEVGAWFHQPTLSPAPRQ